MKPLQFENHFLDKVPLCILRVNKNYEIIISNEASYGVLGYRIDEVIGKSFFTLIPERDRPKIESFYLNLPFSNFSYSESHYSSDLYSIIYHDIYTDEEGITVFLKKESIKTNFETRYRVLVENLPGAVYSYNIDKELTVIHMSPKVFDLTGYRDIDFIQNKIKINGIIHPDDQKNVQESLLQSIKNGGPFELEYRIYRKSGEVRWIKDKGEIVYYKEGLPSHLMGFWIDITERKRAENQSHKDRKLLEAIIENSHSVIFVKDIDLNYIMVNRRWEQITGHNRENVIGKKLEEIAGLEIAKNYYEDDKRVLHEGKVTYKEEVIPKEHSIGGSVFDQYFLSLKFPYKDENGKINGICGISTEITAIREAAKMIEEREANLKGILESVNESIWSVDKKLNVIFTNKTYFEEFFFFNGVELTKGMNIIAAIPEKKEKKKWQERYKTVLKNGQSLHFTDMLKINSVKYFFEIVIYPIKVENRIEGVSVFSKNVTEKADLDVTSKLYQSLFDNSTNEIFLISTDKFLIKQANIAGIRNSRYSAREIQNISFFDLISRANHEYILDGIGSVISGVVPSIFLEASHLRKDGSSYDSEVLFQLFTYNGEEFLSAFVTDITDRKASQKALTESELRFSQIFRENVTPMLIINPNNGQIEDCNPAASDYYGFGMDDLKSMNILDLNQTFHTSPEQMPIVAQQVMNEGKGKFKFVHKLKSGEMRDVDVFCSKISIGNEDLVHEIIQDVTERNKYHKALEQQNESLKEIAWIQSHIVRAPLAKIMGLVQILQEEKEEEDFSPDFVLDAILDASNELDRVVREISEKSNKARHLFN
ncbi:PAS domain S-box protein [Cognataquiflexum nitidum]|uniref:PAS domain S-box protein n=1 Tax=Cognataquiflexum nitidum TaxID=2922272 RepID=UPI001F13DC39|nr:PAS domain S-box protein [Cognataquiflexum nitidum]